jgi:ATP-dependent DNA helicase RecQ
MKGEVAARLLLPTGTVEADRATFEKPARSPAAADGQEPSASDVALFEALRAHRIDVARKERVPPYVVASDRTLRELASRRPLDDAALLLVHGIGPGKAARYGPGLLAVIRGWG